MREQAAPEPLETTHNQLVSVINHELRTPLTLLKAPLQLLQTATPLTPHQKRLLKIAMEGYERLSRVVRTTSDMVFLQNPELQLAKQWCDAGELLQQAARDNQKAAEAVGVELLVDAAPCRIWGEPHYLGQALSNLVGNAIKFSKTGGQVWLGAIAQEQAAVLFTIRDQGPGIPKNQTERLFGHFQQLDMSPSRAAGGLGLGLSVCKLIAESHNGKIWLDSIPGEGTTVSILIPQSPD